MNIESKGIFCLLICFGIIILFVMLKSKHFFKCLILSALSGTAALFAVEVLSDITGFSLAINAATLLISSVGGVPSVIMLLITRVLLMLS